MADINYIYSDPTAPELIGPVSFPQKPKTMDFKVNGYSGPTTAMYTLEHQAACCYYTIINAINLAEFYLKKPLPGWSSVVVLSVEPRAGKQLNAFYDRNALRFFYATDPVTQKIVYTASSTDVVAHETGHAILDAMRPDLYNMACMEIWAYHESFGDQHKIINMLRHEVVVDFLLKETKDNLRQTNCVSRIAREMGNAVSHMTGGRLGQEDFLRNAFNNFSYIPPETLRATSPDSQLCAEPHNFSRIFTGAWYDILCGIYEDQVKHLPSKAALIGAVDILAGYTYQALLVAPATVRFYDAVARAMLAVDKINNNAYNQLMNQVFMARGILKAPVKPMLALDWQSFQPQVQPADEVLQNGEVVVVCSKQSQSFSLPGHLVNVEMPADTYYEFNSGECINIIAPDTGESIEHADACVTFLKSSGLIRPDKATPFEIDSAGNLIRSHFACRPK